MSREHDHKHDHSRAPGSNRRRLTLVLALTVTYMLAEAVGGFLTNSLALLSDAGHMLADVAALLFAMLAAAMIATRKFDWRKMSTSLKAG